ncbi:D-amino-acid transaminase [Aquibacillus halophilus]|uniref:D-alanine aminotransferase n=1 Tax=Aquibacillus halophilus TaxID=930132 RepID=A0A6A8DE33_9BACI|nr:D-amino-acid transaminase [Aquibacillus halophilus]MRH41177.1 D-amino-acid transaminase [Aquibacillus halophilus]
MSIGFINGQFIEINQAVIPIEERGHQFGDGVYEFVKVYNSVPFLLEEHINRLEKSAAGIDIKLPYSLGEIKAIVIESIKKSGLKDAEVYFQATRGIAPRNHAFPDVSSSFTLTVKPSRKVPKQSYEEGIDTILLEDERWGRCHIKSLNLLPNILAKHQAAKGGNFEAILVKDGYVTEGTSSNVFVVKNGVLYTTPLTSNILAGITREAILKLAESANVVSIEKKFTPEFLSEADEAFISSTSVEILPIRAVNQQLIGNGKPGETTKTLHNLLCKLRDGSFASFE